ncbi:MAG: WhiB family transcriptional regulator [Actinomycetota bacterium]
MDTIATRSDWRSAAACRGESPTTFFDAELAEWAKRICLRCPVTDACRDDAVAHGVSHGVWGGWTPEERRLGRSSVHPTGPRRDHGALVTPACGACSSALAWPLLSTPTQAASEGRMAIEMAGGREWLVVHRADLRFSPSADGALRCPSCDAAIGVLDGAEVRLRHDRVVVEDTRRRRRRMRAAVSA